MSRDNRKIWVQRMFDSYGITPPPGVIDALTLNIPTDDQQGMASYEVGSFVNAVNELNKAAAADPMSKILVDEQNALTSATGEADKYAGMVQDVYTNAPKLFGSMTPDQIDMYLAPMKRQFDYSFGAVQGAAAKRGNTGSSLEAQAMADSSKSFNEDVLSAGLNVGMTQQQNQAGQLENLFNQYMAMKNNMGGLIQGTGGMMSDQLYRNAQFMAQLPMLLNANATQQAQLLAAQSGSKTPWGAIGTLGGMALGAGLAPFTGGMSLPLMMSLGGMVGGAAGGIGQSFAGGNPQAANASAANLSMLPLLYGAYSGTGTGTGSTMPGMPYSPTTMGTIPGAGSSDLPPSLSFNPTNPVMRYTPPPDDSGLNWASQPSLLMGGRNG